MGGGGVVGDGDDSVKHTNEVARESRNRREVGWSFTMGLLSCVQTGVLCWRAIRVKIAAKLLC